MSKVEKELQAERRYWKNKNKNDELEKRLKELEARRAAAPPPAPAPPPRPAPAPPPPPKPPAPVVHSPEIIQAKERASKYKSDLKSGKPSEDIYGRSEISNEVYGQDYSKDTYIAESNLNRNQIFDFSQNSFGNNQKKKRELK